MSNGLGVEIESTRFKTKKLVLTKKDVGGMRRMKHYRRIRERHVKNILEALREKQTLEGHLVLNDVSDKRGDRAEIIDGNHRWEAITRFLEESNGSTVVRVGARVYDHLNEAEKLEIFRRCNKSIGVTKVDELEVHQDLLPIYKWMQNQFPFPVKFYYPQGLHGGVKFHILLKAYLARHNVYNTSEQNLLLRAHEMGQTQFDEMFRFAEFMVKTLGPPTEGNFAYKSTALTVFAKVYFCNVLRIGHDQLIRRFKLKVITHPAIRQDMSVARSGEIPRLTQLVVDAANRGYKAEDSLLITAKEYRAGAVK